MQQQKKSIMRMRLLITALALFGLITATFVLPAHSQTAAPVAAKAAPAASEAANSKAPNLSRCEQLENILAQTDCIFEEGAKLDAVLLAQMQSMHSPTQQKPTEQKPTDGTAIKIDPAVQAAFDKFVAARDAACNTATADEQGGSNGSLSYGLCQYRSSEKELARLRAPQATTPSSVPAPATAPLIPDKR